MAIFYDGFLCAFLEKSYKIWISQFPSEVYSAPSFFVQTTLEP